MEIIKERILKLCKLRKISLHKLEMDLGYGNGTIRKWDKNTPNIEKIRAVANYFDVTMDYILGEKEKNEEDKNHLDDFTYAIYSETKDLPEEDKKQLLRMARFFREQLDKEK